MGANQQQPAICWRRTDHRGNPPQTGCSRKGKQRTGGTEAHRSDARTDISGTDGGIYRRRRMPMRFGKYQFFRDLRTNRADTLMRAPAAAAPFPLATFRIDKISSG